MTVLGPLLFDGIGNKLGYPKPVSMTVGENECSLELCAESREFAGSEAVRERERAGN